MNHLIKARLVAAVIMGIMFGALVYHDKVHKLMMGREGFLAYAADRYDKFYTHASLIPEVCIWILGFGLFLASYECLVIGISRLLWSRDRKITTEPDRDN